jgi:hypothetical protein
MARKVTFNTDSSLGQFITKLNLEADYVGDLDNLHSDILNGRTFSEVNIPGIKDSNFTVHGVSLTNALNWIESGYTTVSESLTSGTGQLIVFGLGADSGIFNKMTVGNLVTDSDFLILDSATFTRVSGYTLDFDSANIDSARIDNLSGSYINYDSGWGATAGAPYWPGQDALGFNILRYDSATVDSAIYTNISGDSAVYPAGRVAGLSIDSSALPDNTVTNSITITNLTTNTLNFDDKAMIDFTVLRVTDNTGTIQLGGYLTSTNLDSAIA